jgi:hypothetical protein
MSSAGALQPKSRVYDDDDGLDMVESATQLSMI